MGGECAVELRLITSFRLALEPQADHCPILIPSGAPLELSLWDLTPWPQEKTRRLSWDVAVLWVSFQGRGRPLGKGKVDLSTDKEMRICPMRSSSQLPEGLSPNPFPDIF